MLTSMVRGHSRFTDRWTVTVCKVSNVSGIRALKDLKENSCVTVILIIAVCVVLVHCIKSLYSDRTSVVCTNTSLLLITQIWNAYRWFDSPWYDTIRYIYVHAKADKKASL